MRRLLLLVPLIFAASTVARASACATATLAAYDTAGFSCSTGSLTFSNFTYTSTANGGAAVIPASGVTVTLCGDLCTDFSNPYGLLFTASWLVDSGQAQSADISYTVTCSSPCAFALLKFGNVQVAFRSPASASVLETFPSACGSLSVMDISCKITLSDAIQSCTFTPVTTISVSDDISLQGGPAMAGSPVEADLSGVANVFSQSAAPEPSSLLLLASGFIALGVYLRHRTV